MLLHYFFLSAFAWMLVEGLHLYRLVLRAFGSEDGKHLCYCGLGWGTRDPVRACGRAGGSPRPSRVPHSLGAGLGRWAPPPGRACSPQATTSSLLLLLVALPFWL